MRLIRLALALTAVSASWAAAANPNVDNRANRAIGSTVATTAAAHMVGGQTQARLDRLRHDGLKHDLNQNAGRNDARSTSSGSGMDDSIPRGWLMALVTVLLIGHQLRRKHRFLRPQRFGDV